jgi:outer membrane PBP1 activator LpoA protein
MMTRHYFTVLLVLLSSCTATPNHQLQIVQAETLIQQGKNKEAAAIYKQLAATESEQKNQFRLLAADALIKANEVAQSKNYITNIDLARLSEPQRNHLNLLQGQVNLSLGNAEKALAQLKTVQTQAFDTQTKIAYYQSLAFAYSLTGDFLQSTQTLLAIDPYLTPVQRDKNYEAILNTLSSLSAAQLQAKQVAGADVLNGWLALARVLKLEPAAVADNLQQWKQRYPTHPANSAFLDNYGKSAPTNLEQLRIIAVFLPKTGPFADAANVIRTGFTKAYKVAKKNGQTQAEIRFYDSTKTSPAELYQQAVKEGAQLIIGPLDKKDIKSLINNADLTVPVLALNHVEGLNHPKLYQFGLSPIDDAQACATKAHQDGHQNAVVIVPKTEQGKRFNGYLTEGWKAAGGTVVNTKQYDEKDTDFSAIANFLIKPSASNNPDVILLNAQAKSARILSSRLLENLATAGLPIYATSQVYAGDINENRDENLGGITFCDVPWMFAQAYAGELSKINLQDSWQKVAPGYLRLLPLGIDAYNLISHLTLLKTKAYNGATGKLTLDEQNKINRELYCAKFVNGVPKPVSFASESGSDVLPADAKKSSALNIDE